ncbi:MAG TPA: PDZ domain-containing protein [Actinomycetota bacterium]|nr:PDZ domain-containing protein [Actinomycetota bacterium]
MTYIRSPQTASEQSYFAPIRSMLAKINAIVLILALSSVVKLNYVALYPGPTRDAEKLTKVDARTYSSEGSFNLTTVRLLDRPTIAEAINAAWDRESSVHPRRLFYPEDLSDTQIHQRQAAQMDQSQDAAALAALSLLGLTPCGGVVEIRSVEETAPSFQFLRAGDVVISVDGTRTMTLEELNKAVRRHPIGETMTLGVCREGAPTEFTFATTSSPSAPSKSAIGVTLGWVALPFSVKIDASEIGGPSAGLIFALAIYDLLVPEDLTGGKTIAGTGAITPEGIVEIVGGVPHKVEGAEAIKAEIFLAPISEVGEARAALESDMQVIGVRTLAEAVEVLRKLG